MFVVCQLAGDYRIQTDWQVLHEQHGVGSEPVARRALGAQVATYGRLLERYMPTVKRRMPRPDDQVAAIVEQSFHALALFRLAVPGNALS